MHLVTRAIRGTRLAVCGAVSAGSLVLAGLPSAAFAQYPEKPLRMIVPQAVGASTDNVARIVATELARELGGG